MSILNIYLRNANEHTMPVLKALRKSKYRNICLWVNKSLATEPPFSNWKDKHIIEEIGGNIANLFFEWDIQSQQVLVVNRQMQCLLWNQSQKQMDFCVLDYPLPAKELVVTFEDSPTNSALPTIFQNIPCFCDYDTLLNFCKSKKIVQFSLTDTNLFLRDYSCNRVKGAEVYRELATDRLWYRDTFHKNHYEIFDSCGKKHLAEADMDGLVDTTKADPSKHPIK